MTIGLDERELLQIINMHLKLITDDKSDDTMNNPKWINDKIEYENGKNIPATRADILGIGLMLSAFSEAVSRAIVANNKEIAKFIQPS